MVVQAGAARKIMASSPADAEDALLAVEATGREAMTELRNLLGLLSPAGDGAAAPPRAAAGAGGLGAAARAPAVRSAAGRRSGGAAPAAGAWRARRADRPGVGRRAPGRAPVSGEPRPLSPGADLAAYRVVQEGLTNVLRHAGRSAATVDVDWGEELVIMVSDDGDGSGPGDAAGGAPGRGLLGLRERLALYGGELAAGPRPGGGWQVRAVMPTGTAS